MKAVVVYEAGGVDKLIYEDVPTPAVKPGWSLVKVKGFGINRSEIFTRNGYSESVKFPRILGIECVGVIEKSTDVKRLPPGTKVVSVMGEMGRDLTDPMRSMYYFRMSRFIRCVQTYLGRLWRLYRRRIIRLLARCRI